MRLYNPKNGHEFTTSSDDEAHVGVYLDMGWKPAPDPEPAPVGRAPELVQYEPVKPKPTKATAKKSESTDT